MKSAKMQVFHLPREVRIWSGNAVLIPDDESDLRDLDERVLRSDGPPLQTEEPADAEESAEDEETTPSAPYAEIIAESFRRSKTIENFFLPEYDGDTFPGDLAVGRERAKKRLARTQIIEHEGSIPDIWCPADKFAALGTGITLYFKQIGNLVKAFIFVGMIGTLLCLAHIAIALMPSTQGLDDKTLDLLGMTRLAIPTLATELMAMF